MFGLATLLMVSTSAFSQEVPRISKEEAKELLGNPDVIFVDIRNRGELKVKGAVCEDPEKTHSWMGKYPKDKTLILYCA